MKRSSRRAFTLVELLVVIGIIAVLVGILLPTLSRAREQANTAACAAQLRNLAQGLTLYAAENRGSLPYSFSWDRIDPANPYSGRADPAGDFITLNATDGQSYKMYAGFTWWSLINDMSSKSRNAGTYPGPREYGNKTRAQADILWAQVKLSAAFRCPTAVSVPIFDAVPNTYAANMVAMPNQSWEYNGSGDTETCRIPFKPGTYTGTASVKWAIAPAKTGQLFPDNALLWDTPLRGDEASGGALYLQNIWGGLTISGIDNGLLLGPLNASRRYRGVATDKYNPKQHADLMPENSIYMSATANADVIRGYATIAKSEDLNNALGGARFRHQRNTVCNVAFADGSVRGMTLSVRQQAWTQGTIVASRTDFLRRSLMIKRPPVLLGRQVYSLP